MASLDFNANEVKPDSGFDALPAGDYDVIIVASEMKPTQKNDGKYLKLEFQIITGPAINRKLWHQLNLDNPNAQTVQISRGQLSAICHAVGVLQRRDSAELHNRPLTVAVKMAKDQNGNPTNKISSFKKRGGGSVVPSQSVQSQEPVGTATGNGAKAPWER